MLQCQLNVETIATNSRQILSQTMMSFTRCDGLLAWQEKASTGGGVKVWDGRTTTVLSARLSATLVARTAATYSMRTTPKLYV